MRVLFASTQGAGHYHPLVPFIEAVRRRGHEVLVVVPPALETTVTAAGYPVRVGADPPPDELDAVWGSIPELAPDEANAVVVGEIFGRLDTAAMLPTMRAACQEWQPDLTLRELSEYSSAIASLEVGIRHARVAVGLAEVEARYFEIAAPILAEQHAGVAQAVRESPLLTLLPESFDSSPFPNTHRFRDPAQATSPRPLPAWWVDDDRPFVYVTFGSVAGGLPMATAAYRAALDAVADLPVRVLLTIGHRADPEGLRPLPGNVHVEAWVPQADVLGHAAAVVGHGGFGTTLGALVAGVPTIVVPLFADQPENGRRVAEVGAGLVAPVDAGAIKTAIATVLEDGSFRREAARIAAEIRALPPVDDMLDAL